MAKPVDPTTQTYPFEVKSNVKLVPGHFFGIDLVEGGWACGRILLAGTGIANPIGQRATITVGILDWKSDQPPTAEGITGCEKYFTHFSTHVKAISAFGWTIDGWAEIGNPDFPELLSMRVEGSGIYRGGVFVRESTVQERRQMKQILTLTYYSTWLSANWYVGGTPNKVASPLMIKRIEEVKAKRAAENTAKANKG